MVLHILIILFSPFTALILLLTADDRDREVLGLANKRGKPASEFGDALCSPVGSATCALGSRGLMCRSLELR
jgi:hypothetical protein